MITDTFATPTLSNRLVDRLRIMARRSPRLRDAVPFSLSVLVGVVTGLATVIFILLIEYITEFTEHLHHDYGTLGMFMALVAGGALVGLIVMVIAWEAKGGGVTTVMEAVALNRGRLRGRAAPAKVLASSITIGVGGSSGREGPIVLIGASIGSKIGQWVRLTDEQISMLVASGAAAGISAAFNAPIAGCMFALEVILGRFSNRYLGMVVVAAVASNVVSRALIGEEPAFLVPAYPLNSPLELPLYALLGILSAVSAVSFIRILYWFEDVFDKLRHLPLVGRTMIGMFLTGLIGLAAPEVLGSGLEFIGESITRDFSVDLVTVTALFFLKLLATCFTLGSGNSGGEFAPGLFMGAMLGSMVGHIGSDLFPTVVVTPSAFALVGMASMLAGTARAPITAIMLVLEMSNDYRLIVPLMMTVIVSTIVADFLHPDSIYTLKLTHKGIRWLRGHDVDVLQTVTVQEVITINYATVSPEMKLVDLLVTFSHTHHHGFPIVDEKGHLKGIITLSDIENAQAQGVAYETPVLEFATTSNIITVFPDDPIFVALRRMNVYNIGRLPVVSRRNEMTYLGMIRRADILKAYDIGITRKSMDRHRQEHFNLRHVDDHAFIEVEVTPDAPMVNKTLAQFPYSSQCLLVSIRRNGAATIAHGNTRIEVGDLVTAYATISRHDEVRRQFTGSIIPLEEKQK